jgi:beta-lactamase class A
MRTRIAAVQAFLRHRPGVVGVVLRDSSTGAVWENAHARTDIYMASTSKLAMAVTLLMQNQAGVIHLSAKDMSVMHDMLHVSSDTAADTL